jgi:hypothetical protein
MSGVAAPSIDGTRKTARELLHLRLRTIWTIDYDFLRPSRICSRYDLHGAQASLRNKAPAGTDRWENRRDGHGQLAALPSG